MGVDTEWLAGPLAEAAGVFAPWERSGWALELDSVLRRPMDASGGPVVRAMAMGGTRPMILAWNCEEQLVHAFPAHTPYDDESGRLTLPLEYRRYVFVPGGVVTDALLEYFRSVGMDDI